MPTLEATCSLDIGCPEDEFADFCDQHPDRTVVVYANTSAAVKARADWVVTSSIAVELIEHLDRNGEKILWAPDKHLGSYVRDKSGADVLCWDGACIVHEEFKAKGLQDLKAAYPDAAILVHPESPAPVVEMADVVGSTSQLIKAACEMDNDAFIVATDKGIFYKMQQLAPGKTFLEAPTAGSGATCRSCAHCPWMAMNGLQNMLAVLEDDNGMGQEIFVDPDLAEKHGATQSHAGLRDVAEKITSDAGRYQNLSSDNAFMVCSRPLSLLYNAKSFSASRSAYSICCMAC